LTTSRADHSIQTISDIARSGIPIIIATGSGDAFFPLAGIEDCVKRFDFGCPNAKLTEAKPIGNNSGNSVKNLAGVELVKKKWERVHADHEIYYKAFVGKTADNNPVNLYWINDKLGGHYLYDDENVNFRINVFEWVTNNLDKAKSGEIDESAWSQWRFVENLIALILKSVLEKKKEQGFDAET